MGRRLIGSCALLLLLVGCGGGDSKDKAAASSTTSTTGTEVGTVTTNAAAAGATTVTTARKKSTTPTAAPSASDAARVAKLVLATDDFPAGWKGTPAPAGDNSDEEINRCAGLSGKDAETAHNSGDDFSNGGNAQASAEAATVKDDATYRRDLEAVKSSKMGECLEQAFKKEMQGASGTGVEPSFEQSELSVPKYGDQTVGRRLVITVKSSSGTSKFYIDIVFMGKTRAEVLASFLDLDHPFDQNLEKSLLEKLGGRVNAA
jgi:hypothetical protein